MNTDKYTITRTEQTIKVSHVNYNASVTYTIGAYESTKEFNFSDMSEELIEKAKQSLEQYVKDIIPTTYEEKEDDYFSIIDTIKSVRMSKGISQYRLAKISGISQQAISRIEAHDWDIRLSTLRKLMKILDIHLTII